MTGAAWDELGRPAPRELAGARLVLHHAAQLPAAFGLAHVPAEADWSHTALRWDERSGAFVSRASAAGVRVGLSPVELVLVVERAAGSVAERLPLVGRTIDHALAALAEAVARASGAEPFTLTLPQHELPDHPLAHGAAFAVDGAQRAALAELGRWYAASHATLTRVGAALAGASQVVVWPHHFDIATLVTVGPATADEHARTIGVGMTPGDTSYAEPYLYVTPWPYPAEPELEPLAGAGRWHDAGWFGALLTGSDLVALARGARAEAVLGFLSAAIDAARRLIAAAER